MIVIADFVSIRETPPSGAAVKVRLTWEVRAASVALSPLGVVGSGVVESAPFVYLK